jgi:hypothetical protein
VVNGVAAVQGGRETRIDLIRGLSLLLIFVGHADFTFSAFVQQSRGFSDASESFVMMAGMSAGLAYFSLRGAGTGWRETAARTWRRAGKLYLIHIALVALLVAVVQSAAMEALPAYGRIVEVLEVSTFWSDPVHHLRRALMLTYMPADLDILPLYIVLLMAVPLIFALYRRSPVLLLALSAALWLLAGVSRLNLPNDAIASGRWYFDPLSWQLIFIIGIVLGIRVKRRQEAFPYHPVAFAAAAVFCLLAIPVNLLVRYVFSGIAESTLYHLLTTKVYAGILRLLNAFALVYVVWNLRFVKRLDRLRPLQPLYAAGRHSLPVFVIGIVLSMTLLALMESGQQVPLPLQLLLLVAGCVVQLAFAVWLDARARGRRTAVAT